MSMVFKLTDKDEKTYIATGLHVNLESVINDINGKRVEYLGKVKDYPEVILNSLGLKKEELRGSGFMSPFAFLRLNHTQFSSYLNQRKEDYSKPVSKKVPTNFRQDDINNLDRILTNL
jgi:hypothetical protein